MSHPYTVLMEKVAALLEAVEVVRCRALPGPVMWVSVAESLPPPEVQVLTWDGYEFGLGRYREAASRGRSEPIWLIRSTEAPYGVTHWMPLVQP